jgi:hypothetical protein
MPFFNDSAMTEKADLAYPTNPVYIPMVTSLIDDNMKASFPLYHDPDIITRDLDKYLFGGFAYILLCNATVYDATYTWLNGTFGNFTSLSIANATMAAVLNGLQQPNARGTNATGLYQIASAAFLSAYNSSSAQELADKVAIAYSQTALGYAAGVFSSRANVEEQSVQTLLVTRLPIAPFFSLIIVNGVYVFIGIVVAFVALLANASSDGTGEVVDRLSVSGLIAHAFKVPLEEKHEGRNSGDGASASVVAVERVISEDAGTNEWAFRTRQRG